MWENQLGGAKTRGCGAALFFTETPQKALELLNKAALLWLGKTGLNARWMFRWLGVDIEFVILYPNVAVLQLKTAFARCSARKVHECSFNLLAFVKDS